MSPRTGYVVVQTPNGPVLVPREQVPHIAGPYGGDPYEPQQAGRGSDAVGR